MLSELGSIKILLMIQESITCHLSRMFPVGEDGL